MSVPVPDEVRNSHLQFANSYAIFGAIVSDMGTMDTDPLRGLVGATRYLDGWKGVMDSIMNLSSVVQAGIKTN